MINASRNIISSSFNNYQDINIHSCKEQEGASTINNLIEEDTLASYKLLAQLLEESVLRDLEQNPNKKSLYLNAISTSNLNKIIKSFSLDEAEYLRKKLVQLFLETEVILINEVESKNNIGISYLGYSDDELLPLEQALFYKKDSIVKLLIDAGADTSKIYLSYAKEHLYQACEKGNRNIVRALLQTGLNPNGSIYKPSSPYEDFGYEEFALNAAIKSQDEDTVKMLLDAGANPNPVKNEYCEVSIPLLDALSRDEINLNIVKMLLKAGANPNQISLVNDNKSPLAEVLYYKWSLSEENAKNTIKLLIDAGADVNQSYISASEERCNLGNGAHALSPLILALKMGYTSIVELLIDEGADVNHITRSCAMKTPLGEALKSSKCLASTVKLLVKAGADANFNGHGDSYLNDAMRVYHLSIENKTEIFDCLLKAGANPNYSNDGWESTLMESIPYHEGIAYKLVEYGADVNYKDLEGHTALKKAIRCNKTELAKFLIASGAKV